MITFTCACGKKVTAPDKAAGKKGKCPSCGSTIQVPAALPKGETPSEAFLMCAKCQYPNEPNSKFCQECGGKLQSTEQVRQKNKDERAAVEPRIPCEGILIEFGYSSSASYDDAVRLAQAFATYEAWGDKTKTKHRVVIGREDIASACDLWAGISRWKTSKVYLNGKPVKADSVFGFVKCKQERDSAYRKEGHCFLGDDPGREIFSPWGCIALDMPFSGWGANWLAYGKWNPKGNWHFDKQGIHHALMKRWEGVRFCPHIDVSLMEKFLKGLPESVDPKKDPDWAYFESYEASPATITVKLKQREDGFAYEETIQAKGVQPQDGAAAMRIWENALRKSGLDPKGLKKRVFG